MSESIATQMMGAIRGSLAEDCKGCPYQGECGFCVESASDEQVVDMFLLHEQLATVMG